MIRPGPNDFLTMMTTQALTGSLCEARTLGRIMPRIFFGSGCGSMMHIRLRFDDFVALAVARHRRAGAVPDLLRTMGFTFFNVALQFAEMREAQPHLLTAEHASWDSTVLTLLKSCGPKFVVVVDQPEPSSIMAIGLHPASCIGFTAPCRPGRYRGFALGPIREMSVGAAQAQGMRKFLKIYAPESN